jgi:methyl-accepting chemotaxis protein
MNVTRLFSRLSIGARIAAGFSLILLFIAALSLFALDRVTAIGSTVQELVDSGDADSALGQVQAALASANQAVERFARTRNQGDQEIANKALATLDKTVASTEARFSDNPAIAPGHKAIKDGLGEYRGSFETVAAALQGLQAAATKTEAIGANLGMGAAGIAVAVVNSPELQGTLHPLRLPAAIDAIRVSMLRYVLSQSVRDGASALDAVKYAASVADEAALETAALSNRAKSLIKGIHSGLGEEEAAIKAAIKATADLQAGLGRLSKASAIVEDRADKVAAKLEQARAAQGARTSEAVGSTRTLLVAAAGVALALGAALAWLLGRSVSAPITHMSRRMDTLAAGDLEARIPGEDHRDEIGQMARAVAAFRDAAISKTELELETAGQRREAEEERRQREQARAQAAEQQAFVVGSLANGLERLSAGDLTYRLEDAFSAEYEKLRADFNAAMEQLQDTMRTIAGNASGMHSGTSEISQAADDLSRRTEQQAASLEQTAAALDEITATVRKTAESATHARSVVSTAKSDAERSGEIVGNAVAAMGEIEKSAGQISQIIGGIDEIAFQTNLLALNAGVEAARAGEAGRGFAVVAQEVRALAQRSAEAAKEIKALISASVAQVSSGVALVGETGQALSAIAATVTEINAIVAGIAASAAEQSTGLAEVNTAVNQMDQVTQQNAAMVEQTTAASHSLADQANELAALIGRFRLGQDARPAARVSAPATTAPAARKPTPPAPKQRRSLLQTLTGRGSNLAVKAEPSEESWEEF